jgi:hypothetical protein
LPPNNHSGFNYGLSTVSTIQEERNSTPPIPEPEFTPSISSTRGFIETTRQYERQNIFGRSNEYEDECDDDDCPLPSDSDTQTFDGSSQSIVSNIGSTNSSWDFVRQYSCKYQSYCQ